MSDKRQRAIQMIRDTVAAENRHDIEGTFAAWADDMQTYWNGALVSTSKEQDRAGFGPMHEALPDYDREIQWIGATDDRVVFQWVTRATHVGRWLGRDGTGKRIELHGCSICEFDGEKLTVGRIYIDQGDMDRQLGGRVRAPTDRAIPLAPTDLEPAEQIRLEATGERLIRSIYSAEAAGELDDWLDGFSDPMTDHLYGTPIVFSRDELGRLTQRAWEANPGTYRDIEGVTNIGNRSVVEWNLHIGGDTTDSQGGCGVVEHDGQFITRTWAYYADVMKLVAPNRT